MQIFGTSLWAGKQRNLTHDHAPPGLPTYAVWNPSQRVLHSSQAPVFHLAQITPWLYRSSRPNTLAAFNLLKTMGIQSILDLSDRPLSFIKTPFCHWHYGLSPSVLPPFEEIIALIYLIQHVLPKPILIHCVLGRDRTSVLIYSYLKLVYQVPTDLLVREWQAVQHHPWPESTLKGYLEELQQHFERLPLTEQAFLQRP
jgi:hypothetical protein